MAGRKPKPTALKLLTGNPGKRAINKAEPKAPPASPKPPRHLSPLAKKQWRQIAPALTAAGLLTVLDEAALGLYCDAFARYLEANEQVAKHGTIIKSPNGYPVQNPYLSIANKAFSQMKAFLVEFGLTPSSRSRVTVEPAAVEDPFDAYLRNRGQGS